jgi:hypothetical protein
MERGLWCLVGRVPIKVVGRVPSEVFGASLGGYQARSFEALSRDTPSVH